MKILGSALFLKGRSGNRKHKIYSIWPYGKIVKKLISQWENNKCKKWQVYASRDFWGSPEEWVYMY